VERELVIPAAVSGLLWSVAQTAVFVANEKLSQTIVFPIVGCLPSVVAVVWSVFVFHEIRVSPCFEIKANVRFTKQAKISIKIH
jgi:glucose uptake protein GlcU